MSANQKQTKSRVPDYAENHPLRSAAQKYFIKLGNNKVLHKLSPQP